MGEIVEVPTPAGPCRLHVDPAVGAPARAVLVLGGGASGQVDTPDLRALAAALPGRGTAVVRVELPWRVAGRRVGPRPPASDPWWDACVAGVREQFPGLAVYTGGRSAGARIACRTAGPGVAGVVALAFPLHPPGRPASSRLPELAGVAQPVLLVSGAADPFGSVDELTAALRTPHAGRRRLVIVPGATHSFPGPSLPRVVAAVAAFVADPTAAPPV